MDILLLAIVVSILCVTGGYAAFITLKYGWTKWFFEKMNPREKEVFGVLLVLTVMAVAVLWMRVYAG